MTTMRVANSMYFTRSNFIMRARSKLCRYSPGRVRIAALRLAERAQKRIEREYRMKRSLYPIGG